VNSSAEAVSGAPIEQESVIPRMSDTAVPGRHLAGSLLLILLFMMTFNFIAVTPLLPLIIDTYGITQAAASLLIGAVSIFLAAGMLPGGMLVARLGVRRALLLGGALTAASVLTPLAPSYPALLVLRVVFAAGASLVLPGSVVLIMQWFPPRELPLWNAASGAAQSFGLTIATVLAAPLAAVLGWQNALAVYGAFALVGVAIWLLFGREHPAVPTRKSAGGSVRDVVRLRATWLLAIAFAGPTGQFLGLTTWLPTYYQSTRGLSLEEAGALVGILTFVGIPGTLLGGFLPQRFNVRRPFLIACGAAVGIAGAGTYLLPPGLPVIAALILAGALSMFYFPVLTTTAMELPGMTPATVGVVLGLALGLGNGTGFVAPFTIGLSADLTGSLVPGFLLWSILSMSLLFAGLLLPETGGRKRR
jgi:cyanate permease